MMSFGEPEIAVTVDGTGPAVLLLHGIGGSFAVYQAQARALLVVGERDTLSPPKLSARIAAGHENRTLDVVPGIGHWIPLEAPSQLAELLTSFAARTRFVR
jgi:pimeloyl-ACP methyl ester carboxylesterase